jgi:hypothetical protein
VRLVAVATRGGLVMIAHELSGAGGGSEQPLESGGLHPARRPSIVPGHEAEGPSACDGPGDAEVVPVSDREELLQRFAEADPQDIGPARVDLLADSLL